MIYITEMDFANEARLAEWHAHYLRQIANLQTVPGFFASQRFHSIMPTASPYVALHDVVGPELFTSEIYVQRGGRGSNGDWQKEMSNWHRNLYDWPGPTPNVSDSERLIFVDEEPDVARREMQLETMELHWLKLTGLDRTIANRGLAVVSAEVAAGLVPFAEKDPRIKIFRPMTAKIFQSL